MTADRDPAFAKLVKAKLARMNADVRREFGPAPTIEQHIAALYNYVAALLIVLDEEASE